MVIHSVPAVITRVLLALIVVSASTQSIGGTDDKVLPPADSTQHDRNVPWTAEWAKQERGASPCLKQEACMILMQDILVLGHRDEDAWSQHAAAAVRRVLSMADFASSVDWQRLACSRLGGMVVVRSLDPEIQTRALDYQSHLWSTVAPRVAYSTAFFLYVTSQPLKQYAVFFLLRSPTASLRD